MGPRQLKYLSNRWSDSLFKFDRIILSECRTIFIKNKKKWQNSRKLLNYFFNSTIICLLFFFICFCLLFMFFQFVFIYFCVFVFVFFLFSKKGWYSLATESESESES